jgi:hypothetical protein
LRKVLGRTYVFGEKGEKVRQEESKRESCDFTRVRLTFNIIKGTILKNEFNVEFL